MKPCRNNGFAVVMIFLLSILIFYQVILTFIFPFRWNIFVLIIELFFLFFFIARIIWPY